MMNPDVVWTWCGGCERGSWWGMNCAGAAEARALVEESERGGRIALPGRLSVGPPDGPPALWRFERLGRENLSRALPGRVEVRS